MGASARQEDYVIMTLRVPVWLAKQLDDASEASSWAQGNRSAMMRWVLNEWSRKVEEKR